MDMDRQDLRQEGFSIIELIVAIVILTVGVLGLAGTTAFVIRTVTMADVNTDRAAALQTTIERLRALPFDDIESSAGTIGSYEITWTSDPSGPDIYAQSKRVEIVTVGPGMGSRGNGTMSGLTNQAVDTFSYIITRR